jgi:hypothetical protein
MDLKQAECEVGEGWIQLAYIRIRGRLCEHRKEFECCIKDRGLLD